MKKVKKITALLLSCAMALSMLAGCGNNSSNSPSTGTPSTSSASSAPAASIPSDTTPAKPANWPTRDITITVGYAAGGDVDLNARCIAKYLSEMLGVNVAVVNTTGASGVNATIEVADSNPDGYNVLFKHNGQLATEAYGGSPMNLVQDLETSCGVLVDSTYVLVAAASTGFENFADMVEYAKAHPGELKTVAAAASNSWNIIRSIESGAGIEFDKVEGGSSVTDRIVTCLAGEQQILYGNYNVLKDYIENGDFILLGSIASERSTSQPDIPTLTEQGCPVESIYDFGFHFPKGTPQEILDYFAYCMEQICQNPDFIAEEAKLGPNVVYRTPEEWKQVLIDTKQAIIDRG